MPTITGTLQTILNNGADVGSIEVALCGYGSYVPRLNGQALAARVTDGSVGIGSDGSFSFQVEGNDLIQPDGTYYTITVKNDNGDIVQVNAYQFLSGQGNYDLDSTEPFDPSQGPPSVPPFILDLLQIVNYDPNAVFAGDIYTAWQITLTGDCSPQFTNLVDGNLYTIIIIQDAAGNHAFNWPANVKNATWVNPDPNGVTVQTFVAIDGELYPIGAGTYWQ
jgi:hypothetical protein